MVNLDNLKLYIVKKEKSTIRNTFSAFPKRLLWIYKYIQLELQRDTIEKYTIPKKKPRFIMSVKTWASLLLHNV